ncbi:MAG TPA: hydroxymyristoyl-ACP dehydratase [Clostridium sp.]|uniref:Hydroxymyristoyl-ACP dehydratase n=1 Tax=Acetivibrio mesophilus TaxID=2487273 RepID=A0A4Q0I4U2_9FIRM|nr:hydroxymyristoyl-ACP dehydratase [Acetivibrio mesophilus]HHV28401.1 hydroxymyristoyl-ACP dehydratase [Clostridium sp.]
MTTINCSSNCVHQQDGKCTLDSVTKNSASVSPDCVFFEEKVSKRTVREI